jgi:hypothetical protein
MSTTAWRNATIRTGHRFARQSIAGMAVAVLVTLAGTINSRGAATITVTSADDNGPGSLRNALASAGNGDVIDATGVSGTILLTTGELVVSNSLTIVGPGPANLAVDGNFPNTTNRVFHVQGGVTAAISGLTISNGMGRSEAPVNRGGGIRNDRSTLTVSNCVVTGNSALFGGGIANLGAGSSNAVLTILNCTLTDNSAGDEGGAIYNEGVNLATAVVVIVDSTLATNSAFNRGGAVSSTTDGALFVTPAGIVALQVVNCAVSSNSADFGGGISSVALLGGSAKAEIADSTVSHNTATSNGGGMSVGASLGGIATNTVTGTAFRENSAANGGGLLHSGNSLLVLANSTMISNSVLGSGGGIMHSGNATLLLSNSTVTANSAASDGGGVFIGEPGGRVIEGNPTVEIFSSTLSGNSAVEGAGMASRTTGSEIMTVGVINSTLSSNVASFGGGILNFGRAEGTTAMRFANTTFSGNSASVGGGILNTTEMGGTATVEVVDTILNAGALGNNIDNVAVGSATVTSFGHNLSSDAAGGGAGTGPGGFLNATGDIRNTDPLLGPLQDNGGPTLTHALLAGSPAIDAGDPNFTPPPDFDQRGPGFDRVVNGRIDIGAFEAQTPTPPATVTCEILIFTNDVQVTTNGCGASGDIGVTVGTPVQVSVNVCADPSNTVLETFCAYDLTLDGGFFAECAVSPPILLAPGECTNVCAFASMVCSNAGVRTFEARLACDAGTFPTCSKTVECCAPPPSKCPLTIGYWKNHSSAWPVATLSLGCQTYTQAELLKILGLRTGTGPKADASLILADQLIAAKLNIANGSDPAPVAATIADADNLLCGFSGKLPYKVRTTSPVGKAMVRDANILNRYNNAKLTPNCTR